MAHITHDPSALKAGVEEVQSMLSKAIQTCESGGGCAEILGSVAQAADKLNRLKHELLIEHIQHHILEEGIDAIEMRKGAEELLQILKPGA